ncbi:hypothetical protein ABC255_09675 [Neobacillus sp. 3P2-tot-E-2]|uniref:hypothetical protein n=1 Tax=Neobacillus sp. 3P2-tot-E-2 TaxID=3132212 RepID=UPI00399F43E8
MSFESSSSTVNPSSSVDSSSVAPSIGSSSTSSLTSTTLHSAEYEAIMKYIASMQKPPTAGQIKAEAEVKRVEAEVSRVKGDSRNKTIVICMIGIIAIILTIFGCYIFVKNPQISKDVWVVIGPIIIGCTSGTIGFLTGERKGSTQE